LPKGAHMTRFTRKLRHALRGEARDLLRGGVGARNCACRR
jgi:hypothetical protein